MKKNRDLQINIRKIFPIKFEDPSFLFLFTDQGIIDIRISFEKHILCK